MTDKKKQAKKAVALDYPGTGAPRVVAKGRGEIAGQIEAAAAENVVPLIRDAALAETLMAVPLDEEIPESLYLAVAEVLIFVYSLGKGARDNQ